MEGDRRFEMCRDSACRGRRPPSICSSSFSSLSLTLGGLEEVVEGVDEDEDGARGGEGRAAGVARRSMQRAEELRVAFPGRGELPRQHLAEGTQPARMLGRRRSAQQVRHRVHEGVRQHEADLRRREA